MIKLSFNSIQDVVESDPKLTNWKKKIDPLSKREDIFP